MVGEFFQHALKSKAIDPQARFEAPSTAAAPASADAITSDEDNPAADAELMQGQENDAAPPPDNNYPPEESRAIPLNELPPVPPTGYDPGFPPPPPPRQPDMPRQEQNVQRLPIPNDLMPLDSR